MAHKENSMLKYKITETINYCLDLSCITPQETNAIHSLYKHFSTLLLEEFNCTPKNKGSKIFYLAFNYGSLNGNYIGYSNQDASTVRRTDNKATFLSFSELERILIEYIKNHKIKKYSKNIKMTLQLIKHI